MAVEDNFDMLKAMYNFEATLAKTLSFQEGDHFILHQSSTKQRNWWQVININGQIGFVPSNYVTNIKVEPSFMVDFLNECITQVNSDPSPEKQELLVQLLEKQQQIEQILKPSSKKHAPQPPSDVNHHVGNGNAHKPADDTVTVDETMNNGSIPSEIHVHTESPTPYNNGHISHENNKEEHTQDRLHNSQSVTEQLVTTDSSEGNRGRSPHRSQSSPSMQTPASIIHSNEALAHALYSMVERVRRDTQLSHDLSRIAVSTVLDCLKELTSKEACVTVWSLSTLANASGPLPAGRAVLRSSADARRLRTALGGLTACAQDAQQRAWALHDDNHFITQHLQEVITVLPSADVRVSQDILSMEQYEYVNALVLFYQMETRWHIRQLLIQVFGIMCALDREVVKVLGGSVLPRELARDMLDNPKDTHRLAASSRMLVAILSMADPLPITHFEQLDADFVSFLLDLIETIAEVDEDEHVPDQFITLILAYNLQFQDPDNNFVLEALQSRNDAKIFTEKLLLLLNREDDPVRVLDHPCTIQHSVLKLALDTFSRRTTASLFYTNDTRVLLDITVRQLADLSAGDERRRLYLKLCLGILRHTDYSHCHRQADLLRCFTRIFCEEGEASVCDQALVRTISNEFPQYFKA
ncbi:NCK-interacting protein with SH3 domain [Arctopsyche grandis]|uniref:NCK-interacting protein with SH3 domain n=1 Tax=Arctopsyche grandis TaxID=121162 RepID=UPI00406D89FB